MRFKQIHNPKVVTREMRWIAHRDITGNPILRPAWVVTWAHHGRRNVETYTFRNYSQLRAVAE